MAISSETWAIVAATVVGPVASVAITLAITIRRDNEITHARNQREDQNTRAAHELEKVRELTGRRLYVFRTLMSTRRLIISNEHVNAINLVEVDFYGCDAVQNAWQIYRTHLFDDKQGDPPKPEWNDKRDNLLARLLFEIGKILGYDIPAIEIYQGGYAPKGWLYRDAQTTGALGFLNEIAEGKRTLPITLHDPASASQVVQEIAEFYRS